MTRNIYKVFQRKIPPTLNVVNSTATRDTRFVYFKTNITILGTGANLACASVKQYYSNPMSERRKMSNKNAKRKAPILSSLLTK